MSGGGGGGAANPDTRYANLDQLYGVQTQASQFMLDNALPHVPEITQNSFLMNQQAQDGTLGKQLGEQAGNNATATMGAALDANARNMQRSGMSFSANRLLSENNRNAIMGAGLKVGEMNKASQFAEDQKWNRNAAFYGQVMGMNNGAMSGMSQAGMGMANTANQMNANDQKNAAGYGQAGAAFASGLFKARGGYIEGESRRVPNEHPARLASGGNAWAAYKTANPVQTTSYSSGKRTSPYMATLSGAAPQVLAAGLKDIFKGDKSKIIDWGKQGANYIKGLGTSSPASNSGLAFETNPDVVAGNVDSAGNVIGNGASAADGSAAADAALAADTAVNVGAGVDVANTATTYAAPVADSMAGVETIALLPARGGYIKKPGLCMALGGMAKSSVANSDKLDSDTVAAMDSSNSLSVAKMGDTSKVGAKNTLETHAKPVVDTQYSGKTDGMGESSDGDPDGFGTHNADMRHVAGKTSLSVIGRWLGGPLGGMAGSAIGEVIHPIAEPISRTMVNTGDSLGGVSGALLLDPIASASSGKYSQDELAKGNLSIGMGIPWAGSMFANGGEAEVPSKRMSPSESAMPRKDFTPGGDVQGPGTETSDSIPAQLSDGEIVENADAVDVAGKDVLLKINNEGLKVRDGKKSRAAAQKHVGLAMIKRGKQLVKKGG